MTTSGWTWNLNWTDIFDSCGSDVTSKKRKVSAEDSVQNQIDRNSTTSPGTSHRLTQKKFFMTYREENIIKLIFSYLK